MRRDEFRENITKREKEKHGDNHLERPMYWLSWCLGLVDGLDYINNQAISACTKEMFTLNYM